MRKILAMMFVALLGLAPANATNPKPPPAAPAPTATATANPKATATSSAKAEAAAVAGAIAVGAAEGGSASAGGGSVSIDTPRQAPALAVSAFSSGPCTGPAFSAGVTTPVGGVAGGAVRIEDDCPRREWFRLLIAAGMREEALRVAAESEIAGPALGGTVKPSRAEVVADPAPLLRPGGDR